MIESSFEPHSAGACCLCGASDNLTGEHKIKAAALRAEFGSAGMVVTRIGDPDYPRKPAQGSKAKAFHFSSRVCRACNGSVTQPADRAFDSFHQAARVYLAQGDDPAKVFEDSIFAPGTPALRDVFRYFAKLLCCHLADARAPRSLDLALFARGLVEHNPISLSVDRDWTYAQNREVRGKHPYAAQGGLVVYANRESGAPAVFHSTVSVGPLRFVYEARLNEIGQLDLALSAPEFWAWCREQARAAVESPLPEDELSRLGIAAAPEPADSTDAAAS